MEAYTKFTAADGNTILVEGGAPEGPVAGGVVKAGLGSKPQEAVTQASVLFEGALGTVIRHNADALIHAVRTLAESPEEVEVSFALKVAGEVGNFAVAKLSGEANYSIRLLWKRESASTNEKGGTV